MVGKRREDTAKRLPFQPRNGSKLLALCGSIYLAIDIQGPLMNDAARLEMFNYFAGELLDLLPADQQHILLYLALFDEVPLPLVQGLFPDIDIERFFVTLVEKNFFVSYTDPDNRIVLFHHLFRLFLWQKSRAILSREEQKRAYLAAGAYYLQRTDWKTALRYFRLAKDYRAMEEILRRFGLTLLATKQLLTLKKNIDDIPEDFIQKHAWLVFFLGTLAMDTQPAKSYPLLARAHALFCKQEDILGEIISITQLVAFHISVDGFFKKGYPLLERAEQLYRDHGDSLPEVVRIRLQQALGGGYCFFHCDLEKARYFAELSLARARRHGFEEISASSIIILFYVHAFGGDWQAFSREIENSLSLMQSSGVSPSSRQHLLETQITFLALKGDFQNYLRLKRVLFAKAEKDLVSQGQIKAFLYSWSATFAIAEGRLGDGREILNTAFEEGYAAGSPHLQSQYKYLLAFIAACEGKRDEALAAAKKSLKHRERAGGYRFLGLHHLYTGAAFVQLGLLAEAENSLEEALRIFTEVSDAHLLAAAFLHRAFLWLQRGDEKKMRADLLEGLGRMRRGGFDYFFSWAPQVMVPLLGKAVHLDIEKNYAEHLARRRFNSGVLDSGEFFPLLRVQVLGRVELSNSGANTGHKVVLTPAQRRVICYLASVPGQQVSLEEFQLVFWPDIPPNKARSRCDTLISRLRTVINELMRPSPAKRYLMVDKGMLKLANAQIDVVEFKHFVETGFACMKKENKWQAANAFHRAFQLWQGPLPMETDVDEVTSWFSAEILDLYIRGVESWGTILREQELYEEAIALVRQALPHAPTNDALVRLLYHLYVQGNDAFRAATVLREYKQALLREEYLPAEIDEIMAYFWRKR
ncbi:BTAD domain-containing putative transcriptional regulator [Desulfolithobacter dissulfuricans]|nr:BTAD domain-containing putative transcriptional regulator [Desulfolithobacter dissulfuricans]